MDVVAQRLAIVVDEERREENGDRMTVEAWEELAHEFEKALVKVLHDPAAFTTEGNSAPLPRCIVCHKDK
jgi:hypothetical protein